MSIIEAYNYSVPILYEDESLIFLDKPSSLFVHPYPSESKEKINLMKIVRDHLGSYVYPIHRLDRPVSGVLVFGKNPDVIRELQKSWHTTTQKIYHALVRGGLEQEGEFSFDLNNDKKVPQKARTCYQVIERLGDYDFVKIQIFTGRRHQIRRHFSRRMHHVIGDTKYGKGVTNQYFRDQYGLKRIFLHASKLEIIHPSSGRQIAINAALPQDLQGTLDAMRLFT